MKIEKWQYNDEEVEVPIVDDEEIERNVDESLDKTQPIEIINDEDAYE